MSTIQKNRRRWLSVLVVAMLLGAVLGISAVQRLVSAAPSGPEVVLIQPEDVRTGDLVRVTLVARNVQNLAGFQSTVRFDPGALQVHGAIVASDLERGGRGMLPFGPVMRDETVALGAVTCPVANCSGNSFDQDQPRTLEGVSGEVKLGTLELSAGNPGTYSLHLENVKLVDPQGNPLDVAVRDLALRVTDEN